MEWRRRHVLGLSDFRPEEIEFVIDTARSMEEVLTRDIKKVPALRGKTVVNLFFEASTRTRTSFEMAGKRLSADVVERCCPRVARQGNPEFGPERGGVEPRRS